jgi:phosphoribosyl 1,2-cyclic phosphodiesterase
MKNMLESQAVVRINGVLPDISTLGDYEKSERAAEVKRTNMTTNTSCSVLVSYNTKSSSNKEVFHLLVDVGEGVTRSLEKIDLSSYPNFGSVVSKSSMGTAANIPDAILLTHSHNDHVKELPLIIGKSSDTQLRALKIFCTEECRDQVIKRFPELASKTLFNAIQPNQAFEVGPISVIPISVYHGDDSPPGSVIYILRLPDKKKVIMGWDFLSLPDDVDQNLFWSPDLAVLGTQTYNPHPETGLISVSDAFELVRRWNAKECYIVHYRGLKDFEDAKNQWFRGPTKAMSSEELQKTINENLRLTGKEGRFKITVAKEGMIWTGEKTQDEAEKRQEQVSSIGDVIEIESLQDYVMTFEKDNKKDMLRLVIEDRINRYDLKFVNPNVDKTNNNILYAKGEKGTLATGPEIKMEILPYESLEKEENSTVKINVSKGKKTVFKNDIMISRKDAENLRRYIIENFSSVS